MAQGLSATTQLNVRLNRDVKAVGDRALTSAGITPSQAVRSLWERLGQMAQSPREVRHLLAFDADGTRGASSMHSSATGHKMALVGASLFAKALQNEGISALQAGNRSDETDAGALLDGDLDETDMGAFLDDATDEELYELALEERLQERGLYE